jgi:ankyrin repeat protein
LVSFYGAQVEIPGSLVANWSIFMKSVKNRKSDAAQALLLLGADPNMTYDPWRESAYVYAAENDLVDIVKAMTLCGADIFQIDDRGHNALVVAVRKGNVEIAKHLLENGMSPNWYTITDHKTLLHWAVNNRTTTSTAMIKFLLDAGANPHVRKYKNECFMLDSPGDGFTPLEFLMDQENKYSNTTPFDQDEIVIVNANAKLLKNRMEEDVANRNLAFCMVSIERLSSDPKCLLASLCGEPSLLHVIMDKVVESFDIDHPEGALPPNVKTTGMATTVA